MRDLSDIPPEIPIVWWGKDPWEPACTKELRVPIPDDHLCHGCYNLINLKDQGLSNRAEANTWIHYHAVCWAEAQEEARQALKDRLEADLVDDDEMSR